MVRAGRQGGKYTGREIGRVGREVGRVGRQGGRQSFIFKRRNPRSEMWTALIVTEPGLVAPSPVFL